MKIYKLFFLILLGKIAYSQPSAEFTANKTTGCDRTVIRFDGSASTGYANLEWDFGNGKTATNKIKPVVAFKPGNYQVKLTARDGGQDDIETIDITIRKGPTGEIIMKTLDQGCVGDTFSFSAESSQGDAPIVSHNWIYGDGYKGTGISGKHAYSFPNPITGYPLVLEVVDSNGCSSKNYKPIKVSGGPQLTIKPDNYHICDSLKVNIVGEMNSSLDVISFNWDLGNDLTNSEDTIPGMVSYDKHGKYEIKLEAEDTYECKNSVSKTIHFYDVTAGYEMQDTLCLDVVYDFVPKKNDADTFYWKIDDILYNKKHQFDHDILRHKFYSLGAHYVELYTSNDYCMDTLFDTLIVTKPEAGFKTDTPWVCTFPYASQITDTSKGLGLTYRWEFGIEGASNEQNPLYTYKAPQTIFQEVRSRHGCLDTAWGKMMLKRPKPVITASQDTGCLPKTIVYNATESEPISNFYDWKWTVLAGAWTNTKPFDTIVIDYSDPIIDSVRLITYDSVCGADTTFKEVRFGNKPSANYSTDFDGLCAGSNNHFENLTPAIGDLEYRWSFNPDKWFYQGYDLNVEDLDFNFFINEAFWDGYGYKHVFDYYYPDDSMEVELISDFYSCTDTIVKKFEFQGPLIEIHDLSMTSCSTPLNYNLKYTVHDANKVDFSFINQEPGKPDINFTNTYPSDTILTDTFNFNLAPGFYELKITGYNSRSHCGHEYYYDHMVCDYINADTCYMENIMIPVSNQVKAGFSIEKDIACWNEVIELDYSSSENEALVRWQKEIEEGGLEPLNIIRSPMESDKFQPYINTANFDIPYYDEYYNYGHGISCDFEFLYETEVSKTSKVMFCDRGVNDVMQIVTAINGCADSMRLNNLIKVYKPEADLIIDDADDYICKYDSVTFSMDNIIEDTAIVSYDLNVDDDVNVPFENKTDTYTHKFEKGLKNIELKVTDLLGCINKDSRFVNVIQPTSEIKAPEGICVDSVFEVVSVREYFSYEWVLGDGAEKLLYDTITNLKYSKAGSFGLKLICTDEWGCKDTAVSPIEVYGKPGFRLAVDTNFIDCPIRVLEITNDTANKGVAYRSWLIDNTSIGLEYDDPIISSPAKIIYMPIIEPGHYDLDLEIFTQYCGSYSDDSTDIFEMGGPSMKMNPIDDFFCRNTEVLFSIDSSSLYNDPIFLNWAVFNLSKDASEFYDSTRLIERFDVGGTFIAELYYKDTLDCERVDTGYFNIDSLTADFYLHEPICEVPKIYTVLDSSIANDTNIWIVGNDTALVKDYSDTINNYGMFDVTLIVKDSLCTDSLTKNLYAHRKPKGIIGSRDSLICAFNDYEFLAHNNQNYKYKWDHPFLEIENDTVHNLQVYLENVYDSTYYTLSVKDDSTGCSTDDSLLLRVQRVPNIDYKYRFLLSKQDTSYVIKDSTIYLPSGDSVVLDITTDQEGMMFRWIDEDGILDCDSCMNPQIIALNNSSLLVIPSDSLGCYSERLSKELLVEIIGAGVVMPTAFSPNSDGVNDILKVEGRGLENLVYFRVFNRDGVMVFETNDLLVGWNGKYNGKYQPSGIYIYHIKAKPNGLEIELEKQGTIKLIR